MHQQSYILTLLGVVFVAAKASAQQGLDSELGTKWETFKKEFGELNHYELLIWVLSATHDTATIEPTSPIGPPIWQVDSLGQSVGCGNGNL